VGRCKFQIWTQRTLITLPQCALLKLKNKPCDSHFFLLSTLEGT